MIAWDLVPRLLGHVAKGSEIPLNLRCDDEVSVLEKMCVFSE